MKRFIFFTALIFSFMTLTLMATGCTLLSKLVPSVQEDEPDLPNIPIVRPANLTDRTSSKDTEAIEPEQVAILPDPEQLNVSIEKTKTQDPSLQPIVEKPAEKKKKPDPKPEQIQKPEVNQAEFERSTSAVSVSKETFVEDKTIILNIIGDLDQIMQDQNYDGWLNYLDTSSINYWSQRTNLQKAANRLPVKGIRLTTLEDYFRYVFISSRAGKRVDEIRYDTNNSVKAVQVSDDIDVVYYNFLKMDGIWKLHLPTLSE